MYTNSISVEAMWPLYVAVLSSVVQLSLSGDPLHRFPPYFKFGAASSAYQVEGGWNADGKGENVWDRFVREHPDDIKNNDTGAVSANSYHYWREDVKAAAKMKLQFYRFSINWPRILPTGFTNKFSKAGAKYYSDLIDAILAEGIEPIITLYHWELPVKIQDLGGWTNPLIVKWFGDYARVVYSLYADRVKTWLTINEPSIICDVIFNDGLLPPKVKEPDLAPFLCNRHIMLAHAQAYRIFDQEFRARCPGRISIVNNVMWLYPATANDTVLAELGRQNLMGRYSHPIFSKKGGWPPSIEKLMFEVSLKEGYSESRLPPFTRTEIEFMRGTGDFYGLNYYTSYVIRAAKPGEKIGSWYASGWPETKAILEYPPDAKYGAYAIYPIVPQGFRKLLRWMKQQYGNIDILITENGLATTGSQLDDYDRIDFIKEHLEQILLSIHEDGVNVIGYGVWSLTDNFEWLEGYTLKFGLHEIDFAHPNRTRIPRASASYYACVIESRSLDVPDSCFNKNNSAITTNSLH